MTLRGDGTVTYAGEQHVKVTGEQTWKIDPAAVRALAKEMEDAGFFELQDEYRAMVTDHPTTYTSLKIGEPDEEGQGLRRRTAEAQGHRSEDRRGRRASKKYVDAGRTSWWPRSQSGDADRVRALLADGANVKAADEDGVTLVMRAAETGQRRDRPAAARRRRRSGGARSRRPQRRRSRPRRAGRRQARRQFELILRLLTDEHPDFVVS